MDTSAETSNREHEQNVLFVLSSLRRKPKVRYVTWIVPPFRGMTIPPFGIFIHARHQGDDQILAHDLVHWRQYERMGFFMYYFRYFMQLLLIGYDTMPMEMEARMFDDERTKWNYRSKYHKK
jgi:hypothetical protein